VVAADDRSEVQLEEVTGHHHGVRRVWCGSRCATGRRDGLERRGPSEPWSRISPSSKPSDPALGQAGLTREQQVGRGTVAHRARGSQELDLAVVLDRTQLLDDVPERDQLEPAPAAVRASSLLDGDLVRLVRQPPKAGRGCRATSEGPHEIERSRSTSGASASACSV